MGILNLTPDSFYADSRVPSIQAAVDLAGQMLDDGAAMLDLGAASTRPGANEVSTQQELDRLLPSVQAIAAAFPDAILSVDTYRAAVAEAAVRSGAGIVNDVSGGADPAMFATVARLRIAYVLMHSRGTPATMAHEAVYEDIINRTV